MRMEDAKKEVKVRSKELPKRISSVVKMIMTYVEDESTLTIYFNLSPVVICKFS